MGIRKCGRFRSQAIQIGCLGDGQSPEGPYPVIHVIHSDEQNIRGLRPLGHRAYGNREYEEP